MLLVVLSPVAGNQHVASTFLPRGNKWSEALCFYRGNTHRLNYQHGSDFSGDTKRLFAIEKFEGKMLRSLQNLYLGSYFSAG